MSIQESPGPAVPKLVITTLGQFQVKKGEQILSDNSQRSYRLWELFKYLITHREKSVFSDAIIEHLWAEQEYTDPKHALRTQVYRLRQLLAGADKGESPYIAFANGCYRWNTDSSYWLDVDVFEQQVDQGQLLSDQKSFDSAIESYRKAVSLYRGDYLPESSFNEWVISARNYYHRLYLQAVFELIELLKNAERYEDIIQVCEKTFGIEFFEEYVHIKYMEALLKENKVRQAKTHYEKTAAIFFKEMGVKPSSDMRQLYRKLQAESGEEGSDLGTIQESLSNPGMDEGAFVCDPEFFRDLYKLELRRNERNGQSAFIGMVSFYPSNSQTAASSRSLRNVQEEVQTILKSSLRRGDVITPWNESQFLVFLPGLNFEQAEKVVARIFTSYNRRLTSASFSLKCDLQPLQAAEFVSA